MQYFGQKQHSESIHLMYGSIQTAKRQARWTMKIDTHQTKNELIQETQGEGWYDSNSYESIQLKSVSFYDTIQIVFNLFKSDTIQKLMNWFSPSKRVLGIRFWTVWIDSNT